MMFSNIYPRRRTLWRCCARAIKQASAAGMGQVLTFGHTRRRQSQSLGRALQGAGPLARDHNVMIVVKQHGGETGTGAVCAEIIREVDHPNIKVNYDAGNVMDYLRLPPDKVLADLASVCGRGAQFLHQRTIATSRRRTATAAPAWARSITTDCWRRSLSPG